jgi:hypothetical protein
MENYKYNATSGRVDGWTPDAEHGENFSQFSVKSRLTLNRSFLNSEPLANIKQCASVCSSDLFEQCNSQSCVLIHPAPRCDEKTNDD